MVALPREVSGELSAATSFEVKSLEAIFRYSRYAPSVSVFTRTQVSNSCLIMDAVANLPGETVFQYRLKMLATRLTQLPVLVAEHR